VYPSLADFFYVIYSPVALALAVVHCTAQMRQENRPEHIHGDLNDRLTDACQQRLQAEFESTLYECESALCRLAGFSTL
jgi:hypothetical protein